ncbi:MAG: hypothetical protein GY894_10875 [Planctomycetes bacterium]|nr:hypothetical protein [Planctomycetota bacterium]MCP4839841.1 hypothetical protein [Planctomycetota bacterium]
MRNRFAAASLLVASICSSMGLAASTDASPATLLEDFVHYTLTAQIEMAQANGEALLKSGLDAEQLAALVDEHPRMRDRLPVAIRWAREVPALESVAASIESTVEQGRLDLARDGGRIDEAIEMLSGTRRARMLAHDRLVEAGEYAVPTMLRRLANPETTPDTQLGVTNTLPALGREAVLPLSTALAQVPEEQQVIIINTLAEIGYPHAAAAILETGRSENVSEVVAAASARALKRLGWDSPESIDLAGLHVQLAEDYLRQMEHLRARPTIVVDSDGNRREYQNIWQWDPHEGLVTLLVPTDLYWPVMAVRNADAARSLQDDNATALAMFVAGNLRIENRLGDRDVSLPVPELERSPAFHATVHGPGVARDVLIMAIDQGDTEMARDALAALARTGGASSLLGGHDREPMTEALNYPDQRVRYDAALVVARAMPSRAFPGSNQVVPLLGAAVRGESGQQAAIAGGTPAERDAAAERLNAAGYQISAAGGTWQDVADTGKGGASDLVYLMVKGTGDIGAVEQVTDAGIPVVMVVPEGSLTEIRTAVVGLPEVGVIKSGASDAAFASLLDSLGLGEPLSDGDQRYYAAEAISALRDLAMTKPAGLDVTEATELLKQGLTASSGPKQLMVAEVLALLNDPSAQQALVNASLNASDEFQQIALLDLAAASVRRFGDRVSARQAADLRNFISHARGDVADAAGRLYGALDRGDATASVETSGS